jgi:hypothetical protein
MANLVNLIERVRSGVFHIYYANAGGNRIGSGSSFTAEGFLITNGHVFDCPPETAYVWIRRDEHTRFTDGVYLRREDFERRRVVASPHDEQDYAVLDLPELNSFKPYQFKLGGYSEVKIGDSILFLGYPFERNFMAAHTGIVSSIYNEAKATVFQIDASVNQSNSGGPLIDIINGNVIGIITRKATGLTDVFEQLRNSMRSNITILKQRVGVEMMGIDYAKVFAASQRQSLHLLSQIERSANVGIGYAFSSSHIMEDPIFQERLNERGAAAP